MTRAEENRRPIRLLPPTEVADAPAPPRPQAPVAVHAADRFRRTLAGTRRTDAAPDKPVATHTHATRGPVGPDTGRTHHHLPLALLTLDDEEEGEQVTPDSVQATSGIVTAESNTALPQEEAPRPRIEQPATGVPRVGAAQGWAEDTAKMISTLCNRADPAFVNWTVTVPMDAETLPDTELVLNMSQHWLSLRFRTQSPQSSQLIGVHKGRLQALLEGTRGLPHGIDIEVI